jgi:hypothetical protein
MSTVHTSASTGGIPSPQPGNWVSFPCKWAAEIKTGYFIEAFFGTIMKIIFAVYECCDLKG